MRNTTTETSWVRRKYLALLLKAFSSSVLSLFCLGLGFEPGKANRTPIRCEYLGLQPHPRSTYLLCMIYMYNIYIIHINMYMLLYV